MPATYPTSLKFFTPNQDRIDVVEAIDVNELQLEVAAMQATMGTNPHLSSVYGDFATMGARMAASDAILDQLAGYFMAGGVITEAQVQNLGADLATLTNGVANAATITALNNAVSTINSAIGSEATSRANGDNTLASSISSLSSSTTGSVNSLQSQITTEVSNRGTAVSGEATTRLGADNALSARIATLETQSKNCETSYQNNAARNYATSGSYQHLYLPNQNFLTNQYGSTINGHSTVGFSGTQTRFYTDFPGSSSLWAITVNATWQGTGGTSNAGVRGIRLVTSGGATLTEFIKNANQDPNDETISVTFIGRLSNAANYYVYPQILQNSGGTLTVRGHANATPTSMWFSRIPG